MGSQQGIEIFLIDVHQNQKTNLTYGFATLMVFILLILHRGGVSLEKDKQSEKIILILNKKYSMKFITFIFITDLIFLVMII